MAAALLLAFLCVRSAFVSAFAERAPAQAMRLWPSNPRALVGHAMERIGEAAARGKSPDADTLSLVDEAARKAPLMPEPFMVRGVSAQVAGNLALAERAFRAAEKRAPRERAPHYFLAQHYLTSGRPREGLRQVAILARLLPNGATSLAPFLASFARTPGSGRYLRPMFRSNPGIAQAVLAELAADAANADLVLALAEARPARDGSAPDWAPRLLAALVEKRQYAKALQVWSATTGLRSDGRLFDAEFSGSKAPPPFNWTFAQGSAGVAEPAPGGGLRLLYYGRENAALASQLLLLPPGTYRLHMKVAGAEAGRSLLGWSLTCLPDNARLLDLPLDRASGGALEAGFRVPATGCAAQRLELRGTAPDVPQQADVTLSDLRLAGAAR